MLWSISQYTKRTLLDLKKYDKNIGWKDKRCQVWCHMLLIQALERQKQADLGVQGQKKSDSSWNILRKGRSGTVARTAPGAKGNELWSLFCKYFHSENKFLHMQFPACNSHHGKSKAQAVSCPVLGGQPPQPLLPSNLSYHTNILTARMKNCRKKH